MFSGSENIVIDHRIVPSMPAVGKWFRLEHRFPRHVYSVSDIVPRLFFRTSCGTNIRLDKCRFGTTVMVIIIITVVVVDDKKDSSPITVLLLFRWYPCAVTTRSPNRALRGNHCNSQIVHLRSVHVHNRGPFGTTFFPQDPGECDKRRRRTPLIGKPDRDAAHTREYWRPVENRRLGISAITAHASPESLSPRRWPARVGDDVVSLFARRFVYFPKRRRLLTIRCLFRRDRLDRPDETSTSRFRRVVATSFRPPPSSGVQCLSSDSHRFPRFLCSITVIDEIVYCMYCFNVASPGLRSVTVNKRRSLRPCRCWAMALGTYCCSP